MENRTSANQSMARYSEGSLQNRRPIRVSEYPFGNRMLARNHAWGGYINAQQEDIYEVMRIRRELATRTRMSITYGLSEPSSISTMFTGGSTIVPPRIPNMNHVVQGWFGNDRPLTDATMGTRMLGQNAFVQERAVTLEPPEPIYISDDNGESQRRVKRIKTFDLNLNPPEELPQLEIDSTQITKAEEELDLMLHL